MPQVLFLERFPSPTSKLPNFYDKLLQDGGIAINLDAYNPSLDRLYDVRGHANMHVTIINQGANGLTYTIQAASKEFTDINTLQDADYSEIKPDTDVATATEDFANIIDISPESTAIRIRFKRQAAGQNTTMAGTVAVN